MFLDNTLLNSFLPIIILKQKKCPEKYDLSKQTYYVRNLMRKQRKLLTKDERKRDNIGKENEFYRKFICE